MHPLLYIFLLSSLSAFLPALLTSGQLLQPVHNGVSEHASDGHHLPRIYIVEVQKPKHLMSASPDVIEQWHKSFLPSSTLQDSGMPRMIASYKIVMSGFAAWLTAEEARAMESKEGFLHARPEHDKFIPQTTHSPDFLELRSKVWNDANTGEGTIIAVIDTGIDPNHASFAGNPMPNPPAEWKGWCYFTPTWNGTGTKYFSPDKTRVCNDKLLGGANLNHDHSVVEPYDEDGHGTHVAATIAGLQINGASVGDLVTGTASGSAPGAYLAVYTGGTEWQILWSVEQAINSGAHIISMSLGFEPQVDEPPRYLDDAIARASLAAVRQGILVSCAACNYGPRESSVCNDAPWIMTVGASTMDRAFRVFVSLDNGDEIQGESLYSENTVRGHLIYPGLHSDHGARVCEEPDTLNIRGKVVMCHVGGKLNTEQLSEAVKKAGALAMIILHPQSWGIVIPFITNTFFPTVHVNYKDAKKLIKYVVDESTSNNARVTIGPVTILAGGKVRAPAVPYFSSRGPSLVNGGIIKPDILGPGVNIIAAKHNDTPHSFVMESGTSMATPHLSGIAAIVKLHLIRQNPGMDWTPAMVRSAIMTTAQTTDNNDDFITDEQGQTAYFFTTGAGNVNPVAALDPGLVYDIGFDDYIRYLCGLGYSDMEILQIASVSVECTKYKSITPEQLNYPSVTVTLSNAVMAKTIKRTVTNVRPGPVSYKASVDIENFVRVNVSPRTLDFNKPGETKSFKLTFIKKSSLVEPGVALEGYLTWKQPNSRSPSVTSPLRVEFK